MNELMEIHRRLEVIDGLLTLQGKRLSHMEEAGVLLSELVEYTERSASAMQSRSAPDSAEQRYIFPAFSAVHSVICEGLTGGELTAEQLHRSVRDCAYLTGWWLLYLERHVADVQDPEA
ncbi:hypothetical protein PJO24_004927 [Salmonella enterica]|nr:hypothetical protein [Salmonella enterica]